MMGAIGALFAVILAIGLLVILWQHGLTGLFAMTQTVVERLAHGKPAPVEVKPEEPIHVYYGGHEITKAVEDIWSPISTVIEAVERQCRREAQASLRYMADRHTLLYPSHPWMAFVRAGGAEYLGWPRDFNDIGPESPSARRGPTREMYMRGHVPVGSWAVGDEKEVVDLTNFFGTRPIQRDEASNVVPLIVGYDVDARPIYDRRVPATAGKEHISQVQKHVRREVKVNDPDTGEYLGSVSVCACGDCESEPWDDRLRNGS